MNNKKGQALLESILIMTILIFLASTVFQAIKGTGLEILTPSKFLQGMARSGVWKPYPEDIHDHPNHQHRQLMNSGVPVR